MMKLTTALLCLSTVALAAPAAPAAPAAKDAKMAPDAGMPAMDMSKMGPGARKPKDEKATKKEIEDFFKKMESADKAGGVDAMVAMNDFPVYMITDDMNGMTEAKETSKEEWTAMMKPFLENMPKDSKTTHKPTITVLSDNLAVVVDEFTMTMGKDKMSGKNGGVLVKKNGNWMWKTMVEAGWGGMGMGAGDKGGMKGDMKGGDMKGGDMKGGDMKGGMQGGDKSGMKK